MGTLRARLRADDGFTLVELIIGIVITSVIIGAIASALIVSFRTTNVTQQRMAESHDAQISSAYLANDVQSAANVLLGSGGNCSGASTELITFAYASHPAVYSCGTSNGEIQVMRTFDGSSVVLAHFAEAARPTVSCVPNADCSGTVASVAIVFTEASGYTYTLLGSRRGYGESGGGGSGPPADVTLLSTGSSSPLWVQGSCPNPGTNSECTLDPSLTASPASDVTVNFWTPTPAIPASLWDKLSDQSDATYVATTSLNKEAKVVLASGVLPPDPSGPTPNPTVELRASSSGSGQQKITMYLYNGTSATSFASFTTKNMGGSGVGDFLWTLSGADTAKITSYADLRLGLAMTTGGAGSGVRVYGTALDTGSPQGLLTIKGSLYINSQSSSAVRLTGKKNARKMTIDPGNFQIWSPGACSGCNSTTVYCSLCPGNWQPTAYTTSLPDPLRSLPAPDPATLGIGGCAGATCSPGVYDATLARTANTTLNPGIYYLKQGISITGNASISCTSPCNGGVMLYVAGGSVTFAGSSMVNLTALSSGIYQGIVVFQARSDANEVKITGNAGSGTTNHLSGIVYVPNSIQVTLATGSAAFSATAVVAQNIKVSAPVCIGPPNLCP